MKENRYPDSELNAIESKKGLNAKIIIDAARKGDPLAVEAFNRLVRYLAIGVINIINIFDPEMIAIGGGVAHTGDFLMDALKARVKDMVFIKGFPSAELVVAELGNDAGVIGAAMLAKTEM